MQAVRLFYWVSQEKTKWWWGLWNEGETPWRIVEASRIKASAWDPVELFQTCPGCSKCHIELPDVWTKRPSWLLQPKQTSYEVEMSHSCCAASEFLIHRIVRNNKNYYSFKTPSFFLVWCVVLDPWNSDPHGNISKKWNSFWPSSFWAILVRKYGILIAKNVHDNDEKTFLTTGWI